MHTTRITFGLLMVALVASGLAQTPTPGQKKDIKITWLGHSAFEIVSAGGTDIMIDPFLTKNPATPTELKDLAHYHPAYVLVTHSHGDHLGDAIELAKMSKAKLVCVAMQEAFKRSELPKELFEGVNVGDLVRAGDVKIHVVPAMHSSEPGKERAMEHPTFYRTANFTATLVMHHRLPPRPLASERPYRQAPRMAPIATKATTW